MKDLPVMRAVRWEGSMEEECWVTCSAVDLEPKPLGPAIPAKYFIVAFMPSYLICLLHNLPKVWHRAFVMRDCKTMYSYLYIHPYTHTHRGRDTTYCTETTYIGWSTNYMWFKPYLIRLIYIFTITVFLFI